MHFHEFLALYHPYLLRGAPRFGFLEYFWGIWRNLGRYLLLSVQHFFYLVSKSSKKASSLTKVHQRTFNIWVKLEYDGTVELKSLNWVWKCQQSCDGHYLNYFGWYKCQTSRKMKIKITMFVVLSFLTTDSKFWQLLPYVKSFQQLLSVSWWQLLQGVFFISF